MPQLEKLTKQIKGRNRWVLLGSVIVILVLFGYFLIPKPASILITNTNSIISGTVFTTEISYEPAPYDIGTSDGFDIVVFPSDVSFITFKISVVAKKPSGSDLYDPLDWFRVYMSPTITGFDTGYITPQFEWGQPQNDASTVIYLQYSADVPNRAGDYYFILQGSTVGSGSYTGRGQNWYFRLTGSSGSEPLSGSTWSKTHESSSLEVIFEGGSPVGAPIGTIPLTPDDETTEENGNGGILPDVGKVPSFEWPILLIGLLIGVKYAKKNLPED